MNGLVFSRLIERLCLTVWIGGGLFLAFVLAPSAFHHLSDRSAAGLLVGSCLRTLHWIGLCCGVLLITELMVSRFWQSRPRGFLLRLGLVVVMTGLTAYSQFCILPRMRQIREHGSTSINGFESLHRASVWCESGVLLLGLAFIVHTERARGLAEGSL